MQGGPRRAELCVLHAFRVCDMQDRGENKIMVVLVSAVWAPSLPGKTRKESVKGKAVSFGLYHAEQDRIMTREKRRDQTVP